jgi:PPIC-type PPIASE domain
MNLLFIIRNSIKHFGKINNLLPVFLIAVIFISGCSKKPERKDYVARVNNSYLTQKELNAMIDTSGHKSDFYKSEIIRNWIDQELLYQQAVDEGIINSEDYKRIIDESKKSLAGAMLLKEVSDKYDLKYNKHDLDKFFEAHKDEFKLLQNAYVMNLVEFNNENDAIKFRSIVLEKSWDKAIQPAEKFSFTKVQSNTMLREDEIYPAELKNVLGELNPEEISIIISPDSSTYIITQLLDKYPAGTVPPFEFVKDKVESSFIASEKQKIINEYIKRLYTDNDIEVKN